MGETSCTIRIGQLISNSGLDAVDDVTAKLKEKQEHENRLIHKNIKANKWKSALKYRRKYF